MPAPLRRMKDPTKAGRLIRQNERRLVVFFREYRRRLLDTLDRARQLALDPAPALNFEVYAASLPEIFAQLLEQDGAAIATAMSRTAYGQGIRFGVTALARVGISASIEAGPLDWRAMDVLKTRNMTALKGIGEATNTAIVRELSEGLQRGEGIAKLSKRIAMQVDGIGIVRARTMARTETMYACNEGAVTRYAQHGIEIGEWLCGGNPCDDCKGMCGKKFPLKSRPPCPLHPNCVCTILPVIE